MNVLRWRLIPQEIGKPLEVGRSLIDMEADVEEFDPETLKVKEFTLVWKNLRVDALDGKTGKLTVTAMTPTKEERRADTKPKQG